MFDFTITARTGWQKVVRAANTIKAAQMGWPDREINVQGDKAQGWTVYDAATGRKLGTMKTSL